MAIQIIGAGMGRTGTLSLKYALEQLGYVKCHHMKVVLDDFEQLPYWIRLWRTGSTDYDAMFSGYQAVVDFPGALYYTQLLRQYPDAKVILTVRDPERWYKCATDTIYNVPKGFDRLLMKAVGLFNLRLATSPGYWILPMERSGRDCLKTDSRIRILPLDFLIPGTLK